MHPFSHATPQAGNQSPTGRDWRRGLYLVTPDEPDTARLGARVEDVIAHASMLQYRNKTATAELRAEQAGMLKALCRRHGIPLIINDDAALAAEIGADGVHLGEDDRSLSSARALLGETSILGASCYNDIERAEAAYRAGAGYLAFGAFFATPTKPNARRADESLLRMAERFPIPKVAIGGIAPKHAQSLLAAGADLIAVVSGVFDAPDPLGAARAYRMHF